ncbi:protein of unknown function [Cupriavidus taiwanensis]|nr:protein of unknown function [Cupriavidus taiwanensis]
MAAASGRHSSTRPRSTAAEPWASLLMPFSEPLSFPRRREPSDFKRRWIPAYAGMTVVFDDLTERH